LIENIKRKNTIDLDQEASIRRKNIQDLVHKKEKTKRKMKKRVKASIGIVVQKKE